MVWTDHLPLVSAFKNPDAQPYDAIALNHLNEVGQWTHDVRHIQGRSNAVADALSRPNNVPIGTAYQLPEPDVSAEPDVTAVKDATDVHAAMERIGFASTLHTDLSFE